MPNTKKLTASVATTNTGTAQRLNVTPLQGGQGREAKYSIPVLPITGVFKIQGHDSNEAAAPGSSDAGWYDVLTVNASSQQRGEIADLPAWVRTVTTTADSDGPDVDVVLEGVQ